MPLGSLLADLANLNAVVAGDGKFGYL